MTEPQTEREDRFPDVSTGIKTAGIVTALSVIAYASVFILLASHAHGSAAILIASLGLATALLILAYIDLRTGLLLDVINFPLIAAGIAWSVFAAPGTGVGWLHSVLGAALGYGLIAGLAYAWRRWRGYEGIGLGDAKLLAAGGAWVGVTMLPVILFVASTTGLLVALIVSLRSQSTGDRVALPFGPCLALGIWIVWCLTHSSFHILSVPG